LINNRIEHNEQNIIQYTNNNIKFFTDMPRYALTFSPRSCRFISFSVFIISPLSPGTVTSLSYSHTNTRCRHAVTLHVINTTFSPFAGKATAV